MTALLIATPALADYAWIPQYQNLWLRLGGEYLRTDDNFDRNGNLAAISYLNQPGQYREYRFFLEPEYGFAQNLSFRTQLNYLMDSLSVPVGTVLSASGLGDVLASLKWNLKEALPTVTVEGYAKVPSTTSIPSPTGDLLLSDGNFDFGLRFHTGYRLSYLFFSASPGFVFRFGGYSSGATLNLGIGARFQPIYLMFLSDLLLSLSDNPLFDSAINTHDASGSGGSYLRLSGSPSGFSLGAKAGTRLFRDYYLEGYITQSYWGRRYPDHLKIGANFLALFNFFSPDERPELREVPLQSKP